MGYIPQVPPGQGMDGDRLGKEIALEINRSLVLRGLLRGGYYFGGKYMNEIWQAIGRAIVAHIQHNMVVTTPVINYQPGLAVKEFPSNEVK